MNIDHGCFGYEYVWRVKYSVVGIPVPNDALNCWELCQSYKDNMFLLTSFDNENCNTCIDREMHSLIEGLKERVGSYKIGVPNMISRSGLMA